MLIFFPEIDRFASSENKQTLPYETWKQNIYVNLQDKTIGIKIIPNWNFQFWYPRL